jgi:hypothetical protein
MRKFPWVQPGDMGYRMYRLHGVNTFDPKGFSGLLAFGCVSSGAFHFFLKRQAPPRISPLVNHWSISFLLDGRGRVDHPCLAGRVNCAN